jgi:hypothetical protein
MSLARQARQRRAGRNAAVVEARPADTGHVALAMRWASCWRQRPGLCRRRGAPPGGQAGVEIADDHHGVMNGAAHSTESSSRAGCGQRHGQVVEDLPGLRRVAGRADGLPPPDAGLGLDQWQRSGLSRLIRGHPRRELTGVGWRRACAVRGTAQPKSAGRAAPLRPVRQSWPVVRPASVSVATCACSGAHLGGRRCPVRVVWDWSAWPCPVAGTRALHQAKRPARSWRYIRAVSRRERVAHRRCRHARRRDN